MDRFKGPKIKIRFKAVWLYSFCIACFYLWSFLAVSAAPTYQINYQGKLSDALGNPVADGDYNMRFRLCTDSSCSSAIFDESYLSADKVTVSSGLFSVMLGSVSTTLETLDFNQTLYLEVNVGGSGVPSWETLLPRKILGSVPNAFNAQKLDGLATTSLLRSDIANSNATITNLTSTNFFATNASTTNATSTNFFASVLNALTSVIDNLTATIANITTLVFGTATGNDLAVTNLNVTSTANIQTLNASSTISTNVSSTNATSTNFYSTNATIIGGSVATTTISGLMTSNFASAVISQWTNDADYITSAYASSTYSTMAYNSSTFLTVTDAASTYLTQGYAGFVSSTYGTQAYNSSTFLTVTDAASTYLTQATAASTYLTQGYASFVSSTYGTQAYNSSTFLTVTDAASTYLSQATAASTYLTQATAASTYLSQAYASSTYSTMAYNSSTFLTITDAASTYLSQATAASTYLTQATAASTYLSQAYASSTYGTMAYNSSTFLTITDAASTYQPIGSYLTVESDPVWLAASSSYLTVLDAASTYLTQSAADTTYLSLSDWFSTTTWPSSSLVVNGNMTSTGYVSLATTTFAFDSMIGDSNRYIKFTDYELPAEGLAGGYHFPMITGYDSASPLTGLGINQNLVVISSGEEDPNIFLGSNSSPNAAFFNYVTSSNSLIIGSFSVQNQSNSLDEITLFSESLNLVSSSSGSRIFFENTITNNNATILHNSSTDALTFVGASSYTFDGDLTVTGTTTADCFTTDGINCLTIMVESDPIWMAASTTYLTVADAASTYLTQGYASFVSSTYNTQAYNSSTFLTITDAASTYLTQATAASTYLSQAFASSTYSTMAYNSSTFLTITDAASTYQPIGSYLTVESDPVWLAASSSYLTVADAASTYLTQGYAGFVSSTYSTQAYNSSTFLTITDAASTYLTQLTAGATYLSLSNWFSTTTLPLSVVSSSLIQVGTITSGTWNSTAIGATYGGTGQTSVAVGDMLYGSGADTWGKLSGPGAANYVLRSTGANTFSWGALQSGDLPADGYASTYVNVGGDTMTGALIINNDLTVSGTSTLATTSLAYDSWIGSALGTKSLQFKDYTVSNGSFVNGFSTNYLESNNDLAGVGVNDNFIVMGTADNNPTLIFSGEGGENISMITYSTSSNYLSVSLLNPSGNTIAYNGTFFGTDDFSILSDNTPTISFGAISDGGESAGISFGTTTDILSFTGAVSYNFDNDLLPSSNLSYNLGSSAARWDNLWAQTLNVGTSTWSIGPTSNGSLAIYDLAEQAGNIRMFIASSTGYVGIGTSNPISALEVVGTTTLATTTMAYGSKIGSGDDYMAVESYYMGTVPADAFGAGNPATDLANYIPMIKFNSPSLGLNPTGQIGGINAGLYVVEDGAINANPIISFISADFVSGLTFNQASLEFATTSGQLQFLDAAGGYYFDSLDTNGAVYSNNGVLTNVNPSSMSYKENIVSSTLNIDALLGLQVKSFDWKKSGQADFGLIAEEIRDALPELYVDDGVTKGYRADHLSFYLLQIAQRQESQLQVLSKTLDDLGDTGTNTGLVVASAPSASNTFSDLAVTSAAAFYGTITVIGEAGFESKVTFKDDIEIEGKLYLDKDQAGTAIVLAGSTTTEVIFEKPFKSIPKVIANLELSTSSIFARYAITKKSTSSFTIIIDQPASENLSFDWIALGLRNIVDQFNNSLNEESLIADNNTSTVADGSSTTDEQITVSIVTESSSTEPDMVVENNPASSEVITTNNQETESVATDSAASADDSDTANAPLMEVDDSQNSANINVAESEPVSEPVESAPLSEPTIVAEAPIE